MKRVHVFLLLPLVGLFTGCMDLSLQWSSHGGYNLAPTEDGDDTDFKVPGENDWVVTAEEPTSTFGADVDSGSYTLMRQAVNQGMLPGPQTVRIEEYVNYFRYSDPRPKGDEPFNVYLESAPSYFGHAEHVQLLRIGLQAKSIPIAERDPVNLVFLIDVSGSMGSPEKLSLVKFALNNLVDKLSPEDTLGIVVYAGADGVVLEPSPVSDKSRILDAINAMQAGGSTNGEAGIRAAYDLAESAFRTDGVNRVVLCTDGDFNVGMAGKKLIDLIEDFRDRNIFLTTLGFGQGNYDDVQMEQLADHGNGNYAYIDSQNEALRVLGENLVSTLQVVAKDVKFQVEFNAHNVERWRLVGYENRLLEEHQFNDDTVDSGDIGAGHSVTALYEIELTDDAEEPILRFNTNKRDQRVDELAQVRIRFKEPDSDISELRRWSMQRNHQKESFEAASRSLRFSAAVTEFAEILRESKHSEGERFEELWQIADQATQGETRTPMQSEFLKLVPKAQLLKGQ
jgi:Ca-activated chloride channel family protein